MGAGDAQRADLSGRERQVAEAYAAGASHRQIADRLFIAPATVRTHLSTIYRKLGVSTKIELLRALEGEPAAVDTGAQRAVPAAVASKRQVTVLHALLDAGIAAQADPETAAALGGRFHAVVAAAVARHRGQLLSEATAEIGACFGIPVSDETDQERAVRCALEIADDLVPMAIRAGLATGPVVATRDSTDRLGAARRSWRPHSHARRAGMASWSAPRPAARSGTCSRSRSSGRWRPTAAGARSAASRSLPHPRPIPGSRPCTDPG